MTIEEKAKEYAGTQDCDAYAGFVNGAEWTLNQIEDWLKNQPSIQYSAWGRLAEDSLIKFKKAMEE